MDQSVSLLRNRESCYCEGARATRRFYRLSAADSLNWRIASVTMVLWAVSGCAPVQRCVDTGLRYVEAKHAYDGCPPPPLCRAESRHFERGWRAGYADVAAGRSGRAPIVPPEQYWRHRYESPQGREKVALWYQGFEAGSMAARQGKRYAYHRVPAHPVGAGGACCGGQGVLPPPRLAMSQQWGELGTPVRHLPTAEHAWSDQAFSHAAPAVAPANDQSGGQETAPRGNHAGGGDTTEGQTPGQDDVEVLKALPPLSPE